MTPRRRGSGEGSIYQRADGRWVGAVSLGHQNGKRVRRSVYGATRDEVRRALTALLRQRDQGEIISQNRETVEEYLERWYQDQEPGWRPNSAAVIAIRVRKHIIPALGHLTTGELAPHHVQAALRRWQATLAPRTCQTLLMTLRQALNRGVRWGELSRNVAALVDGPRIERTESTVLNPDQARRLLAHVADDRLAALWVVGLSLGLRVSEAIGLLWSDVDLERGVLRVREQLAATEKGPMRVPLKTPSSRRDIPLPATCLAALLAHRDRQRQERRAAGLPDSLFIFTHARHGGPLDRVMASRRLPVLLEQAGLPRLTFHGLRHSAASLLGAQGVHPKVVMQILGHSTLQQTMGVYTHVSPEVMRDAADRMDALLSGSG